MNSLDILKQIIPLIESYNKDSNNGVTSDINDFLQYAIQHSNHSLENYGNNFVDYKYKSTPPTQEHESRKLNIERIIAQQILFMNKYVKHYARKIFIDSNIKSLDEFNIVATVLQHGEISKSELIRRNIQTKSVGTEIIRRLINNNILIQKNHPTNMRTQLISITQEGKICLYKLFGYMDDLGKLASGPLTENEKEQLAKLLKKLDDFHYKNFTSNT